MTLKEIFNQGYRRKIQKNYRKIRETEAISRQGVLFTDSLKRKVHVGAFFAGIKNVVGVTAGYFKKAKNSIFKSNKKSNIHPMAIKMANEKPFGGKTSWFKLGQTATVLAGGKSTEYDPSFYRKVDLSTSRQFKTNLAKPFSFRDLFTSSKKILAKLADKYPAVVAKSHGLKSRIILLEKAKVSNARRGVLNRVQKFVEKVVSYAPKYIQNVYGKFKSSARREFIASYRKNLKDIRLQEYNKVDDSIKEIADNATVKSTNFRIVKHQAVWPTVKSYLDKMITRETYLKGLKSSINIRLKSIGKAGLAIGAGVGAVYAVNKLISTGKSKIRKVEKQLLSRQEKNKRISIGLKKSTKFKNRRRKR